MKYFIALALLVLPISSAQAVENHQRYGVLIHQVRGEECCHSGNLLALRHQLELVDEHTSSATFSVRYDALVDERYATLLADQKKIELGGWLEVIPSLAEAAGVEYSGNGDTWHEGRKVLLAGYAQHDRKRIIDTYMSTFKTVFGNYPRTTTAWMIDGWSMEYMAETYGVRVHQITREQWGTDTYNLHGGPPHYPYFANLKWPLVPGNSDVLILRQTAADWYQNYANLRHSYTSQPNDYLLANMDFDYFTRLAGDLLSQTHNPFSLVVLGLENNMEQEYQDEYAMQLAHLSTIYPDIQLVSAADFYADTNDVDSGLTGLMAGDLIGGTDSKVIYITSKSYRVRILQNQQDLYLTDLRLYSADYVDPYYDRTLMDRQAFWIVPFLLDSSRFKLSLSTEPLLDIPWIFRVPARESDYLLNPMPDFELLGEHIPLSTTGVSNLLLNRDGDQLELSYDNALGERSTIHFGLDDISLPYDSLTTIEWSSLSGIRADFDGLDRAFVRSFGNHSDFLLSVVATHQDDRLLLKPSIEGECCGAETSLEISPDMTESQEAEQLYIYRHNDTGVANGAPVRLMAQTYDQDGLPTNLEELGHNSGFEISLSAPATKLGYRTVDVFSDQSASETITFHATRTAMSEVGLEFVADCLRTPVHCLLKPSNFLEYVIYLWRR